MPTHPNHKQRRGNGRGTVYQKRGGGFWYASWQTAIKRETRCTKTTSKATAERFLAQQIDQAAQRRLGLIDARQEAIANHRQAPIELHLQDFENKMAAETRSEKHIAETMRILREFVAAIGAITLADITADSLNSHVTNAGVGKTGRLRTSARSRQARIAAAKAFTRWLADHGKLAHDPLRSVKRPSVNADRRFLRRMLLPEEWTYLQSSIPSKAATHGGMDPAERIALYCTAIQTGLRNSELRSLIKTDLFLGTSTKDRHADGSVQRLLFGDVPFIRCQASETKNAKEARQFIRPDLAAELRRIVARKLPSAPVFRMPRRSDCAAMLRADLADARRRWTGESRDPDERIEREQSDFLAAVNHAGESIDLHCLRYSCGAWLAIAGIHPNTIKTVMRHSSITLTMDTYGALLPGSHATAIDAMPPLAGGTDEQHQRQGAV